MKEIKDGEVRRKEILLTARTLFVTKGYEQTSINDILKIVDIAKGTFYYYFTSKEEVLESIIIDIVEEGAQKAEKILADKSIPIMSRIFMAIQAQTPEFEGSEVISNEIHKVENAKLEILYLKTMVKRMTAALNDTVQEGIDQGTFHTDYPKEAVETLLTVGYLMFDCDTFEWSSEEQPKKVMAFLSHMERMLGAKEGTMNEILKMFH